MFWRKLRRPTGSARRGPSRRETAAARRRIPLSGNLDRNRALIVRAFGASADLVVREVVIGPEGRQALVVYLDGLADEKLIADDVVRPLLVAPAGDGHRRDIGAQAYQTLKRRLAVGSVEEVAELGDLARHLANGDCIVMVGGIARALACKTRARPERTVEEPTAEAVVRGARDGFTEVLRTNTALLRHRVRDPRLRVEERQIGRLTETSVALVYIEGLAREEVVAEARARLARIDVDGVLESGYLEEYVEDAPYSPFPQMLRTERPDRVAAALLEGQIAILTDGTPFALLAPVTFIQFLTSVEDYYERYFMGSFLRLLRVTMFFISLLFPSLYVAVTTFHQELLPTPLVLSIASQREGVPFPAFFEALMLELSFEILREAGLRLPRLIGPAVSIVGVLIIGQAAVQAGLVSPFMVIVVAFTAVASFTVPVYSMGITARLARFGMILLAGSLGIFGIITGLSLLFIHLTGLRSFGVPYLAPLGPVIPSDLKDALIRAPRWALISRPRLFAENTRRQRRRGPDRPSFPGRRSGHGPRDGRA